MSTELILPALASHRQMGQLSRVPWTSARFQTLWWCISLVTTRFRRHTTKRVYGIADSKVAGDPVRRAYETRARQDLNMQVRAIDLGQYAGKTTAACFWLAVAAALAHTRWSPPAQALPGLAEAAALLGQVKAMPVEDLDIGLANRHLDNAAIGLLAVALRRHMCGGPDAAMLRGETLNMVFPAFAALDHGQGSRELHHYKAWVHKLATKEYSDELVDLATSHELKCTIGRVHYRCSDCVAKTVGVPVSDSAPVRVLHLYALISTKVAGLTPMRMKAVRLVVSAPPDTWSWGVTVVPDIQGMSMANPDRATDRRSDFFRYNKKESDALWNLSDCFRGEDHD